MCHRPPSEPREQDISMSPTYEVSTSLVTLVRSEFFMRRGFSVRSKNDINFEQLFGSN